MLHRVNRGVAASHSWRTITCTSKNISIHKAIYMHMCKINSESRLRTLVVLMISDAQIVIQALLPQIPREAAQADICVVSWD